MRKKVGIARDTKRTKEFWLSLYPNLKNWKVEKQNLTYQQAQELEKYYEMMGCKASIIDSHVDGRIWSVYAFEY